jgi:hypothetical protein
LRKLAKLLDNTTRAHQGATGDARRKFQSTVARIVERLPGARDEFKQILVQCATTNPSSLRTIVTLMAFYLHLGPFSRHVIEQIDHRIAELEVPSPGLPVSAMPADRMVPSEAAE